MTEETWHHHEMTYTNDGLKVAFEAHHISEEELKEILERKWIHEYYRALIHGVEEKPVDKSLPKIKPWSPYTDIHDKINGWLNDG